MLPCPSFPLHCAGHDDRHHLLQWTVTTHLGYRPMPFATKNHPRMPCTPKNQKHQKLPWCLPPLFGHQADSVVLLRNDLSGLTAILVWCSWAIKDSSSLFRQWLQESHWSINCLSHSTCMWQLSSHWCTVQLHKCKNKCVNYITHPHTSPWWQYYQLLGTQDYTPEKPHQPVNYKSPKRTFGQKKAVSHAFQPVWFSQWQWLHYNKAKDIACCHRCLVVFKQRGMSKHNADPSFVS